jgi:tetratricopeptide (TPR) repeat protein
LYRFGEYSLAVRAFEAALEKAPEGADERLQAMYGLATVWNLRRPKEDPEKAREYYEQILQLAPKHDLAAWSRLALARMEHLVPPGEDPDYKKVYQAYQEVIDNFPNRLAGHEAVIFQQSTLVSTFRKEDAQKAIDRLQEFVKRFPDSNYTSSAYSLMCTAYQTLKKPKEKLQARLKALETRKVDPNYPFLVDAGTYWVIATSAEFEVGDFETARKYYRKLLEEYPVDFRKYAIKKALERMDAIEARLRKETSEGGDS